MPEIKHLFVLMMENRSFDHCFAFSADKRVAFSGAAHQGMTSDAPDRCKTDQPHEFDQVAQQLQWAIGTGASNNPWRCHPGQLQGFTPERLPVIHELAKNFVLFDNWYSSVPGPTWPNRFFAHAATSGGLADSPPTWRTAAAPTIDTLGFSFQNGTIFDKLSTQGHTWRVYHQDCFPQVLAIKGMTRSFIENRHSSFQRFYDGCGEHSFKLALKKDYNLAYTFIEPDYGITSRHMRNTTSQHPCGSVAKGEQLIKYVYESIRQSPLWETSLLLIVYDEHGGFYDHVTPPPATPPGDANWNGACGNSGKQFKFDRYGFRVPAIAISPWLPCGKLGSELFPEKALDHAAIPKLVRELFFKDEKPLTAREPDHDLLSVLLSNDQPNHGPEKLPEPLAVDFSAGEPLHWEWPEDTSEANAASMSLDGFDRIAKAVELQAKEMQKPLNVSSSSTVFSGSTGGKMSAREQQRQFIVSVGEAVAKLKNQP